VEANHVRILLGPFEGELNDFPNFYGINRCAFRLEARSYEQALRDHWLPKWPKMTIGGPDSIALLVWEVFFNPRHISAGVGLLYPDEYTISLNTFHPEFMLWHRSFIPESLGLLLYADSSERFMEVTPATTHDELINYLYTMHDVR
jgi:hypothetical protein